MIVRRYIKSDVPYMVKYLKEGLQQFHYKHIKFDEDKTSSLLLGNVGNPKFFCNVIVKDDGDIAGALAANLYEYAFSYEIYATDMVLYVREGHGSLQGLYELLRAYRAWAKKWGAREARIGQSTGYKMEKFDLLAKRAGFTLIGSNWSMEP